MKEEDGIFLVGPEVVLEDCRFVKERLTPSLSKYMKRI